MKKEFVKVGNAKQLVIARMCQREAIEKKERPIVIEFINGYDGSDVDGCSIRHERNPYAGCPEHLK